MRRARTGGSRNITSPTTTIISVTVGSDMSCANGSMSHESKSTCRGHSARPQPDFGWSWATFNQARVASSSRPVRGCNEAREDTAADGEDDDDDDRTVKRDTTTFITTYAMPQ